MQWNTLGFIGLGRMGAPIAGRLAEVGWDVWGYDAAGTRERLPAGARAADGVADIAGRAQAVLLSLPHGEASVAVCEEIATARARETELVIDLSTIGLAAARRCTAVLGEAGVGYVDAPVSGGVAGARSGALAIMVGAPPELFATARPLIEAVAQRCFHVGTEAGHGQAAKLLNNYVSSVALAATSEALVFGSRVGLDLEQLVDVLNASSGRTSASTDKAPRSILPRTYDFGFAAEAMRKDVALFVEDARRAGSLSVLARANDELWGRFVEACPGSDFTFIHRYLEDGGA